MQSDPPPRRDQSRSRIAFVLPGFPLRAGGGHKVVYEYAEQLASRGHQVSVLHVKAPATTEPSPSLRRLVQRRVAYGLGRHRRPSWYPLSPEVSVRNSSVLAERIVPDVDVLVATAAQTAPFVAGVASERGIRGAYFIQHFEDYSDSREFVERTWQLPLSKIVIAPWLKTKADQLGVDAVLVPNAVDSERFPPGVNVGRRVPSVLALVSEERWKRTDLVSQVFMRLAEHRPSVRLTTFGVCERPAGMPSTVEHHQSPPLAELQRLYQETRIFLCASDLEGFGLPPAEAMLSGAAVVTTENGGVRAYATGAALFAPSGDGQALLEQIERLLDDDELCADLATRGRVQVSAWSPADAAAAFEVALLGEEHDE